MHGIKVLFYADKYRMTALKDEIIKNHASDHIKWNSGALESKEFKELSEDTKVEIAKHQFTNIFNSLAMSAENRAKYLSELMDIIENLKTKNRPTERKYDLPFQNVFKTPTEHSDIEIVVSKTHSFHLHKQTLKRLSGKFKHLIENNKDDNLKKMNIELEEKELNVFLLMLRFMYPKYQVQLQGNAHQKSYPLKSFNHSYIHSSYSIMICSIEKIIFFLIFGYTGKNFQFPRLEIHYFWVGNFGFIIEGWKFERLP